MLDQWMLGHCQQASKDVSPTIHLREPSVFGPLLSTSFGERSGPKTLGLRRCQHFQSLPRVGLTIGCYLGFACFFFFLRFKNNWCSKNWIVTLWTSKDVSLSQISYVFKTIYLSSFRDVASYWKVVEHNMMYCL